MWNNSRNLSEQNYRFFSTANTNDFEDPILEYCSTYTDVAFAILPRAVDALRQKEANERPNACLRGDLRVIVFQRYLNPREIQL